MSKGAGFLKRLKKLKDFVGKGVSWLNTNVVKPLLPTVKKVMELSGYENVNKYIDGGSQFVDNLLQDGGYDINKVNGPYIAPYVDKTIDLLMDTQRAPQDKRYVSPFGSVIN